MESFKFCRVAELQADQAEAYQMATDQAYPKLLLESAVIKNCWGKLETLFPNYQLALLNANHELLGFINSIPVYWNAPLSDLPAEGWDWLIQKGISDYENGITPNCLGGIQINILPAYQGQGLSKVLIEKGKALMNQKGFKQFIIPIRPTFKSKSPGLKMAEYIKLRIEDKIYDPWIRTHVRNGANIIKVCENAMNVKGNIAHWENVLSRKFNSSGNYYEQGCLNAIVIDLENDLGEYREENVWIQY